MMKIRCGSTSSMSNNHQNCSHEIHKLLHQLMLSVPVSAKNQPVYLGSVVEPAMVAHNNTNRKAEILDGYAMDYDYKGALLFVVGLLCMYGLCILLLIISLIRKSRTELELVDHLRDFEAMRRASQKKGFRACQQSSIEEIENGETPKTVHDLGYKSIRPDGDNDDECSDIMSVSRAKRKARRDSYTESRMSSQDTVSSCMSQDDNLSVSSFSPLLRDAPQVLCMYCARKMTSGECLYCEQEKGAAKMNIATVKSKFPSYSSIIRPNGLSQTGHYSPEREQYWVEKDPKLVSKQSPPKYPRIARYYSVDSEHPAILSKNVLEETEYIPSTSERRASFGNMKLTKQRGLDFSSDDEPESSSVGEKEKIQEIQKSPKIEQNRSQGIILSKPKRLFVSGNGSRPHGTPGVHRNTRWMALRALYRDSGSLCSADVEENIAEEDENYEDGNN